MDTVQHTHSHTAPHPTADLRDTTYRHLDPHTGIHLIKPQRENQILSYMFSCTKYLTWCTHGCTNSPNMRADLFESLNNNNNNFLQVLWSSFQPGPQLSSVSPFRQTHSQVVSSITLLGPQRARRLESSTSGEQNR